MSSVDFDDVLVQIGERGRYQHVMYYLLCIPATLPAAFLAFSQVFVSATPDHWCRIPSLEHFIFGGLPLSPEQQRFVGVPSQVLEDGSRKYDHCLVYDINLTDWLSLHNGSFLPPPDPEWPTVKCPHGWNYDHRDYDSTLVTELDLVCDKSWWVSTSTTFFYVGSLLGNVVFGWIADRWGRRKAFLSILFLMVFSSIATSFSPNYLVYTILRTVNGLFFPAIFQIPFILALEMMGPRYRTFAGMVICMFFAMAMSLLALLGYFLRHWFTLSLATSVPFLLLFSYYWITPESPRWLLSKNRIDEAEVIVQKMAKMNKKPVPPNFLRTLQVESERLAEHKPSEPTSDFTTPMDILRHPNIRTKFFILSFDWVANAVVYNGLSYNATNLGVSDYLAFFIGGAIEIPSYVLTWWAMDYYGRRLVLCLSMLLGGVACVSCLFVPEKAVWVTVSLAMVGKFGNAAAFAVFYVFVGELLPTVLRSQAMGIGSFIAGIGLLSFPHIVNLARYSRVMPLIVMGTLSLAGAAVSVFLPETLHIHLPQTIAEGEALKATFSLCSITSKRRRRRPPDAPEDHSNSKLPNGAPATDNELLDIVSPIQVIITDFDAENSLELETKQ
ncbi:organic cation transporter 1-like [Macrosteles quadrilineatus]|uniref:organic cation transporter 1-like n=1 Tax=Macrosteles quadrilineatus TaxID=74068 RepID=UPI0023E33429|nr:organic cation transporter 1-like [Macrosteles quadrilineatus]XP_054275228.1 organic cation transporter 1-like [Macrosteles quadrilineatus]